MSSEYSFFNFCCATKLINIQTQTVGITANMQRVKHKISLKTFIKEDMNAKLNKDSVWIAIVVFKTC